MRIRLLLGSTFAGGLLGALVACGSSGSDPGAPTPPPGTSTDAGDGGSQTPPDGGGSHDPDAALDSSTPDATPPVSARGQAGGELAAIAVVDQRAYVTVG